ncbi:DNA topoisomerase I [Candidatus Woesearchaeota archaeon]|nr:DNA topoisomerase I [Candidatus Woesearchaeota archaeon]
MAELIITEKPKAAQRIAEALADGKAIKKGAKGVSYYEITHGNKDIIVGCAVGHLFGLAEKEKKRGMRFPVFDVEWKPTFETTKSAAFSKKYYEMLKKLSKDAKDFVVACDLDVEGELIGFNILRFICKQKDARRMKFSTLTKDDLVEAYEKISPHIEWGLAHAGETRHELDWYYGINLSRALTSAIKKAGLFKILSIGRVQGPALQIIVQREKEITAFKPQPFWQLQLLGKAKNGELTALHEKDKFWDKKEADKVHEKVKGRNGTVAEVKSDEFQQAPPCPFDLTTLQTEAYRCFGAPPKATLEIAQELYTSGLISYPRTSSQQLPPTIGYAKILTAISQQQEYAELAKRLLKGGLKPNNGKKTDPAHPAIYPTGLKPKSLDKRGQRIYDQVVRRFLATFAEAATRETMTVKIDVNGEMFIAAGTRTKVRGWHEFYGLYARFKEMELPQVIKGETVTVKKLELLAKETKPPARYTEASIIKELEKRNLGTKATRAEIVDTLFKRGYVSGRAVEATNLGIKIIETLGKYSPEIIDEELTRHFELEMEEIQEDKKKGGDVLEEAKTVLVKIIEGFKKKEKDIGEGLFEATKESETKENTIGKCPTCSTGTLMMKRGKFGRFIACSTYPECKTTFKLPATGLVKALDKVCETCKHPMVTVIKSAKRPQEVCINPDCPSKVSPDARKLISENENSTCKKCGEGKMVLRRSIYGGFLGCNKFPKCRNIIKVNGNSNSYANKTVP